MTFGAGTDRERHVQHVNKLVGSQHLALPSGTITFVSRETLLRMKRLAGRPIDLADIEKLEGRDET